MKLLGWWLMLVGTLRLASVWFGFFDIWALRLAVFSQTTMTEVHGRTFGVWTLLTCTLCFLCAFNLDNKPLYLATFLSFIYAFGHFLTEYLIYHTMAIGNLTTVGIFAGNVAANSQVFILNSISLLLDYIILSASEIAGFTQGLTICSCHHFLRHIHYMDVVAMEFTSANQEQTCVKVASSRSVLGHYLGLYSIIKPCMSQGVYNLGTRQGLEIAGGCY
ncbi:UNVERIFIED_CONTAM: Ergosterol biosynthetic protein 28 [Sesamum radiatum]|uniref:Ergosterol biosynthetic protein 28 n=1 Tax=Sesamum radiatum TaxID=300843 RepID=A0AAW2QEM4_SESRA